MNEQPHTTLNTPKDPVRRLGRGFGSALLVLGSLTAADAALAAATGKLTSLTIANLSPAFDPNIKNYTVPKVAGNCGLPITAVAEGLDQNTQFYIANTPAQNGNTINAYICNASSKAEIVIYQSWSEKGRYTITAVDQPAPPPPPPISGKLTGLTVANFSLTPAFDPSVKDYTVPMPANCALSVTATAENSDHANFKMYVGNNQTASGMPTSAWVCDGHTKVDVVIYNVWNEVGHYTITPVGDPVVTPNPNPTPGDPNPSIPPSEATPTPEAAPTPPALPGSYSPVNKLSAVRFLEQATFGPVPADIAAVQQVGFDYWMAQQANLPASTVPDGHDIGPLISQQFMNMYGGTDQLRQRVIFALSQIVVISSNKNIYGEELAPYVRLLSKHAFGNYRSLLRDITLSPAMGKYLDLANSVKATASTSPNENYARELMQLFTIGLKQLNQDGSVKLDGQGQPIPTYDQNTLREVSRALTGWTYPTAPGATPGSTNNEYFVGLMEPRPGNHDTGVKNIINGVVIPAGQTVTQDMDAVIDAVFNHPNTAPFVAMRLIRSLTDGNPSAGYIQRVANVFDNNGQGVRGDLYAVLKAVLTDSEATNPPNAQHGHLKDTLLHVTSLGRALGAQVNDPNMFMYIFRNLGQQVLSPTTVFSFYSPMAGLPGHPGMFGPEFQIYTPGLAIQRANFIHDILYNQMGASFSVNLGQFVALGNDPAALVEKVNQVLLQGRMSNELRQIILTATQAGYDANQRAFGAVYLAAISSEFAVQR
ncbi:DUF1800 domain-containing protein [Methylomagnum sp.]